MLFSGDKLLGGPQAGLIVGRTEIIQRLKKNPLKRILRVGKITLAALEGVLRLYRHPELLQKRLPTLRLLTRNRTEIEALAKRLLAAFAQAVGPSFCVTIIEMQSQIGSGSLPVDRLPSAGWAVAPVRRVNAGAQLNQLVTALRQLPVPVLGRLHEGQLLLDCRCLEEERVFAEQLSQLVLPTSL